MVDLRSVRFVILNWHHAYGDNSDLTILRLLQFLEMDATVFLHWLQKFRTWWMHRFHPEKSCVEEILDKEHDVLQKRVLSDEIIMFHLRVESCTMRVYTLNWVNGIHKRCIVLIECIQSVMALVYNVNIAYLIPWLSWSHTKPLGCKDSKNNIWWDALTV